MSSFNLVRHRSLSMVALGALLAGLLLVVPTPAAPAAPAEPAAAPAAASAAAPAGSAARAGTTGRVRGNIFGRTGGAAPRFRMLYFRADWTYLGARRVVGGAYSISLPAGTYRLQFVDTRPTYDVRKFAPSDVVVKVRPGRTALKNVRMRRGAAITGTVRAGGRPGAKARVVVASPSEQSYETVANAQGQFAIGGLPAGNYSVFTYDRRKRFVGRSEFVRRLGAGKFANIRVNLSKKAGGLLVDLYAGGKELRGTTFATAISRRTGQFWTAKVRRGNVSFQGLFPGRYRIVVNDVGRYFGRTGPVTNGVVRPGRTAFGSFRLTQRGGAFTGKLVSGDPSRAPVGGASVRLYDRSGTIVSDTTTSRTGYFTVGGRLRAQVGMTLVVFNPYTSDFETLTVRNLDIRLNQDESLGTLVLPRKQSARR